MLESFKDRLTFNYLQGWHFGDGTVHYALRKLVPFDIHRSVSVANIPGVQRPICSFAISSTIAVIPSISSNIRELDVF